MNLFLMGWNLSEEQTALALLELGKMTSVYPQLDAETLWYYECPPVFAASICPSEKVVLPRRYVWRGGDQITFYDGCPVDHTCRFSAHDAESLSLHWEQLSEVLEGQFVAVRVLEDPPSIELLTDFLGLGQVYYLHHRNAWLISNNVRLISRVFKVNGWDALGVSLLLSAGWVGSDRTLQPDVRVIPGGQRWKWQKDGTELHIESYYPLSKLSCQRRKPANLAQQDVERLADELASMCQSLAQDFGELECGLSGGRDTRLLAALLASANIPTHYYTHPGPSSKDVQIGARIGKALNLPLTVQPRTDGDVEDEWEAASERLLRQNDGMISLWQISDVLWQPERIDELRVKLSGIGGEIARGFFTTPRLFLRQYSVNCVQDHLARWCARDWEGLIRSEAVELTRSYLYSFAEQVVDEGFSPLDALDVFYAYDRVRRWAGTNVRKMSPICDPFAPFCTRPFVEAAFSVPASYRYSEPLHYQLLKLLSPELHGMPFAKGPWRSQRPVVNLTHWLVDRSIGRIRSAYQSKDLRRQTRNKVALARTFGQSAWLEARRSWLRQICLDQADSPLWNFVDRSVFEHVTMHSTHPMERLSRTEGLYAVATLFAYAQEPAEEPISGETA